MSAFQVSPRAERGEKPKHLRQKGMIPMVVIDREHKPQNVKAPLAALQAAVRGADSHGVIELQMEGETAIRKVMLKSIDGDTLARQVLCATFQEVNESDLVKTDVPIVAIGHIPETQGDVNVMLNAVTTVLHIRAKVSDLPDHIEVDVSKLAIGEHISAGDVTLPPGVESLSSPDAILFTVARVPEPVLEEESTETTASGETQAEGDASAGTNESS